MVCTQGHHTHTAGPNDRRGVLGVLGPDAVQQRTREGSTGLKRLQLGAAQRYIGVLGPDAVRQRTNEGSTGLKRLQHDAAPSWQSGTWGLRAGSVCSSELLKFGKAAQGVYGAASVGESMCVGVLLMTSRSEQSCEATECCLGATSPTLLLMSRSE